VLAVSESFDDEGEAGGVFIDIFSGITPEIVRPCEHIVTTAVLASTVYSLIALQLRDRPPFFRSR
jgi:hypothetical protein